MKRFLAVMFMALLPIAMGCRGEGTGTTDGLRPGVTDTPRTDPVTPSPDPVTPRTDRVTPESPETRTPPATPAEQPDAPTTDEPPADRTGDLPPSVEEESADELPKT